MLRLKSQSCFIKIEKLPQMHTEPSVASEFQWITSLYHNCPEEGAMKISVLLFKMRW